MIGSALKKLASEHNMKVASGVAYGAMAGFAATLSEGSGWKRITLTTKFTDVQKQNELLALCNGRNLQKEFRVRSLQFTPNGIDIVFLDNPGTMKKLRAFLDWFLPLLSEHGATGAGVCTQCGLEITGGGSWKLVDGVAFHYHPACGEKVERDIRAGEEQKKETDSGSYLTGLLGALAGSVLGAVVWAIVLSIGYVASVVGLLIGFLAEKGYNLLHGKQGKAKLLILILATVVGVALGTFGGDAISLGQMIAGGEFPGYTFADIPYLIVSTLQLSPDYASGVAKNIVMGLVFAGLGIWGLLRKTSQEVSDVKIVELP